MGKCGHKDKQKMAKKIIPGVTLALPVAASIPPAVDSKI